MSLQQIVNYDEGDNFNFEAALIEVNETLDLARLAQNPASAQFLATLLTADAEVSTVDPTGTIFTDGAGTVTITGSAAEFRAPTAGPDGESALQWLVGTADGVLQGCVRVVITPRGFVATPTNQTFVSLKGASGNENKVIVRLTASGTLAAEVFDNAGGTIVSILTSGAGLFVDGTPVEIEFNWNIDASGTPESRLFVGGTQQGSTNTSSGTRVSANNIRGGSFDNSAAESRQQHDLNGIAVFSTVQHTADYAATGVELYSKSNPNIIAKSQIETDGLLAFTETIAATPPDSVRWFVCVSGLPMWHNGSAWVSSDKSLAQSNTAAEINANVGTLDLSGGAMVQLAAVLHSDDGDTTPSVSQHTTDFQFFTEPDALVECRVFGYLKDSEGDPIVGAPVKATNAPFLIGDTQIDQRTASTVTASDGLWQLDLVESETPAAFAYSFTIGTALYPNRQVPKAAAKQFSDLVAG